MKRYQEIPRDTKRYRYQEIQEIPFGRRYTNGIPLVSFGISWYLWGGRCCRDTKRYQEIPKRYRWDTAFQTVSLGISRYLLVSLLSFQTRIPFRVSASAYARDSSSWVFKQISRPRRSGSYPAGTPRATGCHAGKPKNALKPYGDKRLSNQP